MRRTLTRVCRRGDRRRGLVSRLRVAVLGFLSFLMALVALFPSTAYADETASSPSAITNSGETVWITNTNISTSSLTISSSDFFIYNYTDNWWGRATGLMTTILKAVRVVRI